MTRITRSWNNDFELYMEEIAAHPHYKDLPIERKKDGSLAWFAFAKSELGKARVIWAEKKAQELGIALQYGVYAKVMRHIHPTQIHTCQICGSKMSINYVYPNAHLITAIKKSFGFDFSDCDNVSDIWDQLIDNGVSTDDLHTFFIRKFKILDIHNAEKDSILLRCEQKCREDGCRLLGPGAMSNFPDRFDGFHTYNRCCRATEDTGRSSENLKSYTKDRRAYEYWSDGNIHAANQFMGSPFFAHTSADHIGPISLGFVHDPRYLRPMAGSDNSTKRDRLLIDDIEEIIAIEATTRVYPMSWYSARLWNFIKENYMQHKKAISTLYRDTLKQNMSNFMYIINIMQDTPSGYEFLCKEFIEPKENYFLYSYEFDESGNIIKQTPRRCTERSRNEMLRFKRIAFTAVADYNEKNNRHISPDLTEEEKCELTTLSNAIRLATNPNGNNDYSLCRQKLEDLIMNIENRLIQAMRAAQADF